MAGSEEAKKQSAVETDNKRFEKGSDKDLSNGPVEKRRCTDITCLVVLLLTVGLYFFCTVRYASQGSLTQLTRPRDFTGDACGSESQWREDGQDLEGYPKLLLTVNITDLMLKSARDFLCNAEMRQVLSAESFADASELGHACGSESTSCDSVDKCTKSAQAEHDDFAVPSRMASLLDRAGVLQNLVRPGENFNPVCAPSCAAGAASRMAEAVFRPPADHRWAQLWGKVLREESRLRAALPAFSLDAFRFDAMALAECPYAAERCVPMGALKFKELAHGHCAPQIDEVAAKGVEEKVGKAFASAGEDAVTGIFAGLGSAVGDLADTADTLVVTAIISFVLGFVFLLLLRLFIGPTIWLSLLAMFLTLLLGGCMLWSYATMCRDSDLLDQDDEEKKRLLGEDQCGGLYHFQDKTTRTLLQVAAVIAWVFCALWLLFVACMCKRIRLAISVNKAAACFVGRTPQVILVPVVQYLSGIAWLGLWFLLLVFMVTQIPSDALPHDAASWENLDCGYAWTHDIAAWYDSAACTAEEADPKCWRCAAPAYALDHRIWFCVLVLLWVNALIVAVGHCTVAGTAGDWFFRSAPGTFKSWVAVRSALRNSLVYHLGSLAFGSLVLAVVQFLEIFMRLLQRAAKLNGNVVVATIACMVGCCLWCLETLIKYVNGQAFIQVALMGTGFCTSATNAVCLIIRNCARFGMLAGIGWVVRVVGLLLLSAGTGCIGFLLLEAMHPDVQSPYLLVVVYCLIGYLSGALFTGVIGVSTDTILQCFAAAEEMKMDPQSVPTHLRKYLSNAE